jgi:hypothetical protein
MQQETKGMALLPSMPDVAGCEPSALWKAGDFLLVLLERPKPLSARILGEAATRSLRYEATLAIIDRRINAPRTYITLETSSGGTLFCRFTERGVHENLGLATGMTLEAFVAKALDMFREKFDFSGKIEKLRHHPEPTR